MFEHTHNNAGPGIYVIILNSSLSNVLNKYYKSKGSSNLAEWTALFDF